VEHNWVMILIGASVFGACICLVALLIICGDDIDMRLTEHWNWLAQYSYRHSSSQKSEMLSSTLIKDSEKRFDDKPSAPSLSKCWMASEMDRATLWSLNDD
jgi:hypothetical protein